jgi:hypothetical protein
VTSRAASCTLLGVSLVDRWAELDDTLRALAQGLEQELAPLWHQPFPVPHRKARLTRRGGRCAVDGTPLTIDPWRPHTHECPACGATYTGLEHDDWWAMGAQLWCAERVLHSAMLGAMQQRDDLIAMSLRGLDALTTAWPTYPNEDNALGPTRPFFSTYLESVWLLNLSLAAQVLAHHTGAHVAVQRFCDTVAEPSRTIIRSFPEGHSNRQAWHVAARMAAGALLGDERELEQAYAGPAGLLELLEQGLLPDGSWYEGENYHLFAHRGLWYGVMLAESHGRALPEALRARFHAGFRTPLLGLLPDGTFPSRRDSRYATSVHQWRFAEWCELGLARGHDPVVAAQLQRLYASDHARGDTGRARSTADIERDEPPCALTRADLGWRTVLCARAEPWPASSVSDMPSVVLEAQGLAVLRRDGGRVYVALEGGHTGGGHGHPDRLALTLQDGDRRILEDPGTGSYVERTLHWYRSTLAHNAPLVNWRSQERVATELLAFASTAHGGWIAARARDVAPGVVFTRMVVLHDEHVVDLLRWEAASCIDCTLPMHGEATVRLDASEAELSWHPASAPGAGGLEDGFDFLQQVECAGWPDGAAVRLDRRDVPPARAWVCVHGSALEAPSIWRAVAPGPPRHGPRRLHWLQARGQAGTFTTVWSLHGHVQQVQYEGMDAPEAIMVQLLDGTRVRHTPPPMHAAAPEWTLTVLDHASSRGHTLGGARTTRTSPSVARQVAPQPPASDPISLPARFELGAAHYRRSESSWMDAGEPSATVAVTRTAAGLVLEVDARTGPLAVPAAGAENVLDNERADVNADGVQLYLRRRDGASWSAAWLVVPDRETQRLRITAIDPSPSPEVALTGTWAPTAGGWCCQLAVPGPLVDALADADGLLCVDLIVNERPPHRERRRGQLLLSGSVGEFVYLRGDRHEPARALLVRWRDPDPSITISARSA